MPIDPIGHVEKVESGKSNPQTKAVGGIQDERPLVARLKVNVEQLLKEKQLSMTALGRALRPETGSPASAVYTILRAAHLPKENELEAIAAFLQVPLARLHSGELTANEAKPGNPGWRRQPPKASRPFSRSQVSRMRKVLDSAPQPEAPGFHSYRLLDLTFARVRQSYDRADEKQRLHLLNDLLAFCETLDAGCTHPGKS